MICFRAGKTWKRDSANAPRDSFSLQLDGIDLLSGASEESLTTLVPDLVEAVSKLVLEGEPLGQVSLPEAHLELIFLRREAGVEVAVVDLGRPAGILHKPVEVDLAELSAAVVSCGQSLIQDLGDVSPDLSEAARVRRMRRRLLALQRGAIAPARNDYRESGFSFLLVAPEECSFGLELMDPDDLLLCGGRYGALSSLLIDGKLSLRLGDETITWRGGRSIFLIALELSRQGTELCHAIELGDERFTFAPGGLQPTLNLQLEKQTLEIHGKQYAVPAERLARALFEVGIALGFAINTRNKAQSRNPYLLELSQRCREGLAQLNTGVPPPQGETGDPPLRPRSAGIATRPLQVSGRLRRLRYAKLWEKHKLGEAGRLLLGARGPIFSSPQIACAWAAEGQMLYRRIATHGVAASPDGFVLAAFGKTLLGFPDQDRSASWLREHDGAAIGPQLEQRNGLLIAAFEGRAVLAFSELTGREIWRLVPSRVRQLFLSVQEHRALLADESGHLFGLELESGQIRYRLTTYSPFLGPTVAWGKKFLALGGRTDRHTLFAVDLHTGAIQWHRGFDLSSPSAPVAHRNRIWLAGQQDKRGLLLSLDASGNVLWKRVVPLEPAPYQLLALKASILLCASDGSAALFSAEGEQIWHLGSSGDPLSSVVRPAFARGVVVIPGPRIRIVEPAGGQVLAEVSGGQGLSGLLVDRKLNLYLLDDDGTLSAHRLASHFALVNGMKPYPLY